LIVKVHVPMATPVTAKFGLVPLTAAMPAQALESTEKLPV